ncbi:MAG: YIP1 family protein [Gemmatimonadetes bacterium]|nr:YIP1 family protein [Gemmatimonadota bacterium]
MTDSTDNAPAAPTPPKASLVEDFVDIFVSPREVFARRANSGFFAVMVIVTLLLGGLFLVNRGTMEGIMDAEYSRAMAQAMKSNPNMTQAQIDAGKKIAGYSMSIGAFVGIPIAMLLTGLCGWLTARIVGAKVSYTAATMIATYAFLPRVIESVGVAIQGMLLDTSGLRGRYQLSLGVGRFLDPEMSQGLLGILGRLDVFTLWVTVLIAIGLAVVAKLPREKAILAGVVMWLFGALPSVWALLRA